ncbi:putative zinc finger transcription factor 1 [Rosellinia necatrix]|uniref:Putative zinc finger transcription factor 1 n=1 Tax=Rosellinia necatrix TaxID=77044 RepID=A0A1W2TMU5_ROSNE|nr:putative zinc finger transcription factor 1 [Rosellinia necatrix]
MTEEGGTIYVAMSPDESCGKSSSFPGGDGVRIAHEAESRPSQVDSADLNGFSLHNEHDELDDNLATPGLLDASQFPDFSFPFQDLGDEGQMISLDDHVTDPFATPGAGSNPSIPEKKDTAAAGHHATPTSVSQRPLKRPHGIDGSEESSQESPHDGHISLEDNMSDDFGLSATAPGDGTELGGKLKENKTDPTPAWSELKTKAGKERKRLPLACIACRRKKIRCSGEKPACKHCLRSRIPCVYKVTTRKAAPRTDYMAMLDKRLKRMEDRIIKIVPKCEQDTSVGNVVRGVVKPVLPGTLSQSKQSGKKRAADEAFGAELEHWARGSTRPGLDSSGKPTSLQVQEEEENKLLSEGTGSLPPKDIQEHLAEVFFDNIYGQAYHLLHKPSYIRKLKAGALPPVLVLSVCAISARFSTHPRFAMTSNFLRGEEWAAPARDIVIRRYEWPNITILTCLLLLGLHEFGTCHGGRSWSLGGQATRMAYALQLHKDLEYDPMRPNPSAQLSFIDREIRRRTMWACFLMDRFNSSGTDRPMFVKEETIRIQLPIKEKLFQLDMPGPTEDLHSRVPHPVPANEGQLSDAKDNMGVAAYMIRAIALWGRIISFLNQGGKDIDEHSMWETNSGYTDLVKQAEEFPNNLPEGLKYNAENLHLHKTEGMANQFLFLHISVQQNILFMNRFAVSSPGGTSQADVPQTFVTQAGSRAFAAANKISELLKDAEQYMIAAPFVGYCAFLSSTVHIFGIFSGNAAVEIAAKRNLATNVKFLHKMKRYWGMFHFMAENLREQYKTCADAARQGTPANDNSTSSPIFQYGDWFDRYPHGVSQTEYVEPASGKKKETGDDAVLEQKAELHTVEEFFTQLSPPPSTSEGREATGTSRPPLAKRKSLARKGSNARTDQQQQLEPLLTDLNGTSLPEQIQQRIQQAQQQQAHRNFRLGAQPNGPAAFHHLSNARARSHSAAANYHAMSPISPVVGGFSHGLHGHGHHYPASLYNPDLFSLSLANQSGLLPQLDRQLVFNAYGGLDPTTMNGPEALMDWDALAGHASSAGGGGGGTNGVSVSRDDSGGHDSLPAGFVSEPSSAWFMPFNMEPPELGQDLGNGMVDTFGMFSPGGPLGLRRGGR